MFVPLVVCLSLLTLAVWTIVGYATDGLAMAEMVRSTHLC